MSKELATIQNKIAQLDTVAKKYSELSVSTDNNSFSNAIAMSAAMVELRALLTEDVMEPIMELMNSPLGFLTDATGAPRWPNDTKWKAPYKWEIVRDCTIEATLRGFAMVGNEWNILQGRFYAAKNGLARRVRTFPGLTDLVDTYDIPRSVEGKKGAIVKASATWNLDGNPMSIARDFAIKGDEYSSADAYFGKAARKLMAAILEKLTGQFIPEGELDPSGVDPSLMTGATGDAAKPAMPAKKPEEKPANAVEIPKEPEPSEAKENQDPVSEPDKPEERPTQSVETAPEAVQVEPAPAKPAATPEANPNEWAGATIKAVEKKTAKVGEGKVPAWLIILEDGRKCVTLMEEQGNEATARIGLQSYMLVKDGPKSKILSVLSEMP